MSNKRMRVAQSKKARDSEDSLLGALRYATKGQAPKRDRTEDRSDQAKPIDMILRQMQKGWYSK